MDQLWDKQQKTVLETFRERPGKLKEGVLFHEDYAPAHIYADAMAAVRDCGSELVDHPPYSDLAPSFFIFVVYQNYTLA